MKQDDMRRVYKIVYGCELDDEKAPWWMLAMPKAVLDMLVEADEHGVKCVLANKDRTIRRKKLAKKAMRAWQKRASAEAKWTPSLELVK